ncbi:hypothetical protein [Novosphingobium sp. AAP93]|uniref:hypothetical protein n=1 Tax=Novosphingobium sp. AAP93 TaxID=1523427 RepID=UPI0012E15F22|nr:hypothetical protein [Novosphingobium sp. AAP93]
MIDIEQDCRSVNYDGDPIRKLMKNYKGLLSSASGNFTEKNFTYTVYNQGSPAFSSEGSMLDGNLRQCLQEKKDEQLRDKLQETLDLAKKVAKDQRKLLNGDMSPDF